MRYFLKILAICYAVGAVLHLLDIFDLRNEFSQMNTTWKVWILYLLIFDSAAAAGLWRGRRWGTGLFMFIAFSQLIAYGGMHSIFGDQTFLIVFHIATLSAYAFYRFQSKRAAGLPAGEIRNKL